MRKRTLLRKAMSSTQFIVDIKRLARERLMEAGTTFHREQSEFTGAVVQRHSKRLRVARDYESLV